MYHHGLGVPQDYKQAIGWFRKSANKGNAYGQTLVGWMYVHGDGVPRDYVLAHMWFNLAVAGAEEVEICDAAATGLNAVDSVMTPAQTVEAQRMAREWLPK